jgi:predicted aldo/keto reductase-like oxidoreductase
MYCGGESENAVREALVSRHPRDSFLLADKLHCGYFNTKEEREEYFETQLKKTGAGYFDYYLIHCINRDMYKKHTAHKAYLAGLLGYNRADNSAPNIG